MKLNQKDFKTILKYYKIKIDDLTKKEIQQSAEDILSKKMCRCFKKVNKKEKPNNTISSIKNENKAISIFNNIGFQEKQLETFGFTCKNIYELKSNKKNTHKLKPRLILNTNNNSNKTQKKIK